MTTYTSVFGDDAIPAAEQSYASVSLTSDQAFYWSELSVGDFLLHDLMDIHSAGAYAITLPAANAVSVGRSVTLTNRSVYTISVKDNAGSEVTSLGTGMTKIVYITDNSSAAGVWGVVFLGTGTSVADASALAGGGLKVVDAKLALNIDTMAQVVSYSVLDTDRAKTIIFTNSGAVNCNLLQASVAGDGFLIGVVNQGTGSVSADPYSGEEVDGELTKEIAPGESAFLVCDGANWFTIGHGRSTQFQFTKLVLDISSGTPFTLTSTQAQNKLIQFIGTATENITVNVPAVVAVYYTQCSYSGAYSLTLKTAAGSGVTLVNTDRAIVYCDGADVVAAQTSAVPATTLTGGVAGAVVYQTSPNNTGFTEAGLLSQLLQSRGTGAPTWTSSPTIENLTFSGTGRRITGDFSNATVANRVMFQTSTVNGITGVYALANGSGTGAQIGAIASSDPSSGVFLDLAPLPTDARIRAIGVGVPHIPMTFHTGGLERMRIGVDGNVGIGGTVTASSFIGNASTASTFSTNHLNYKGVTDNVVAGCLMWKHYGNNHVIFDASDSTAPDGTPVNPTHSMAWWDPTHPTLMGWDGTRTHGVRVDTARYAETIAPSALNATGSAPLYACRAWVNFNGTDTVAIRASGNVSSITDNGVGDYTVNFTTAMPDANYCLLGAGGFFAYADTNIPSFSKHRGVAMTASAARVQFGWGGASSPTPTDVTDAFVSIFR